MGDYYWCFAHDEVEQGRTCRASRRLGPYETPEAARAWRDRAETRNESWEAEDKRWEGEDDDSW